MWVSGHHQPCRWMWGFCIDSSSLAHSTKWPCCGSGNDICSPLWLADGLARAIKVRLFTWQNLPATLSPNSQPKAVSTPSVTIFQWERCTSSCGTNDPGLHFIRVRPHKVTECTFMWNLLSPCHHANLIQCPNLGAQVSINTQHTFCQW